MSEFKNLKRPPAMETVFEILFSDENETDAKSLCIENNNMKNRFPSRNDLFLFEAKLGDQNNTSSKSSLIGYSYENSEELTQFRTDGFSYNKLGNYPGWDDFIKNAVDIYDFYPSKSRSIKRLGLRYINVIEIEKYDGVPKNYFNVFLETEGNASLSDAENFSLKYTSRDDRQNCQINVSFQLSDISKLSVAKFILDIDVLKTGVDRPQSSKDLVDIFGAMRDSKNKIFFSFLKEKVLEQYDEE